MKRINPEESYFQLDEECRLLCNKAIRTEKERDRKSYLIRRIILLEAIHYGNPKKIKICSCCNCRLVGGYQGSGRYLENICFYCNRKGYSDYHIGRTNNSVGHKHGARE